MINVIIPKQVPSAHSSPYFKSYIQMPLYSINKFHFPSKHNTLYIVTQDTKPFAFRFLAQLIISISIILVMKTTLLMEKQYISWMVVMVIAHNGLNIGFFTAAIYLPLGELAALEMAGCLLFVSFISRFFLKENISIYKVCCLFTVLAIF